ncbi:hypothetical protein [Streptomyces orinoci]|uniref:Uncharacterized protein n=1 Tax=Streptomyces orinoci TaxID=67339 RepID=A0ABV3JXM2_STRON|nr:hypothetical protein [Streptomyces orinoci]
MGWTHDHRDLAQHRGAEEDAAMAVAEVPARTGSSGFRPTAADPQIGIPRIIRRRARWVSARLRHPRSR